VCVRAKFHSREYFYNSNTNLNQVLIPLPAHLLKPSKYFKAAAIPMHAQLVTVHSIRAFL